jgi:hypothetical protein
MVRQGPGAERPGLARSSTYHLRRRPTLNSATPRPPTHVASPTSDLYLRLSAGEAAAELLTELDDVSGCGKPTALMLEQGLLRAAPRRGQEAVSQGLGVGRDSAKPVPVIGVGTWAVSPMGAVRPLD